MLHNAKLSENAIVVGVIDPDANTAATYLTGAIDMALYDRVMAIALIGDIATNGTVDFKATQATTAGGTYKDVTGKAATQLTQAGTDSNKQVIIDLVGSDLDMDNGYRYVKFDMTLGTAAADSGVVVLGVPKSKPGTDLTTVDEIV